MNILIRVDASVEIGTGHFVRQIALAQLLIDEGFKVYFLTKTKNGPLVEQAQKEGVVIRFLSNQISLLRDAEETVKLAQEIASKWVILDGYPFVTDYQKTIKAVGLKLMCIDDIAQCHFVADIVLNQNTEDLSIYSVEPYTTLLMGPKYALLRREFRHYSANKIIKQHMTDVMITMGGSDEKNMTGTILNWLQKMPEFKSIRLHIVLGGLNHHKDKLNTILNESKLQGQIYTALSAKEMLNLMCKVDLAITAAGSIVWEYLKVGLPFISLQVYENQHYVIDWIAKNMNGAIIKRLNKNLFKIKLEKMFQSKNQILMKSLALNLSNSRKINDIISLL